MILRVSDHRNDDNISLVALEIVNRADDEFLIILARKALILLSFSALLDKTCLISVGTNNANARSFIVALFGSDSATAYKLKCCIVQPFKQRHNNLCFLLVNLGCATFLARFLFIAIYKVDVVIGIDNDITVNSYEKVVLLFIILLLLSDYESALVTAVEVIEHLHNVAMATVLLVEHHSEIIGDFFIKSFEEAFLVKLGVSIVNLFGDDILVKSFKISLSHMTEVVHRRKLTVVTDKDYRFAVKDGDEQIKEGGFRNLVDNNDIDSLRTNINRVDTVFSKLLKLRFCEAVTACTGNAEHIDIVVEHSRICLSIFFENIG